LTGTSVRQLPTFFGDSLGFDHHERCARLEKTLGLADGQGGIARAFHSKFLNCRGAAGAKLDAHFRLGSQALSLDLFNETQPVVDGDRDEAARDFNDIETKCFTLADVAVDRLRTLRQDIFDVTSGRDEHVELEFKSDQSPSPAQDLQ
jgi:hypothetical protein